MLPGLSASERIVADRFCATQFAGVMPTLLRMLVGGVETLRGVVALAEPLLAFYPEAQTIEALGVPPKIGTQVSKDINKLLVASERANVPPEELRVTQLDGTVVAHGRGSVVSEFLAARRRRLDEAARGSV